MQRIDKIQYCGREFKFRGRNGDSLGRFVLAVIREYIANHPDVTFDGLKLVFPDDLQYQYARNRPDVRRLGCFDRYDDHLRNNINRLKRYFTGEDDVLELNNGERIVICSQWGGGEDAKPNLRHFVKHCTDELHLDVKCENHSACAVS